VTYGALSRDELEQFQPDVLVDTFEELRTLIADELG
jgi:phosphoglycolate phosphatase-like HAD superfamily hydrolase